MGLLWNTIGSSEVGRFPIPAKDRQERILLDVLSEDEIVELISALSIRKTYLDTLDTIGPASRARLVLDNEQDWLPGLPQQYYDALSKISNNQVVPPVPPASEIVNSLFALTRKWITGKLFPRKIR